MGASAWDKAAMERMEDTLRDHVERGGVPGLAWLVARRGDVRMGVAGGSVEGSGVAPDTIFRIASMTKPVTAVGALILVEECRLRLDDPVDQWLPELADRQVLAHPGAAIDDTVPAQRPITLRDLLTFRMGLGYDFTLEEQPVVMTASAELGLGAGPPAPTGPPAPDEWMRRLGTLPLARQPGEQWLYHTSADVLGVLVARAARQPLEEFLAERLFQPLGMADTGFSVPAGKLDRFGACYVTSPETGERAQYDPADGQWSSPPAFPSGGGGLVSTVGDYLAFAEMLLAGSTARGHRVLSRPTVAAMTTNQLTDDQVAASGPDPSGSVGWGFGVAVQLRRAAARSVGTYFWDGGLGSSWANDPAEKLIGILLTNRAFESPAPPAVIQDFWTCAYAAVAD